MRGIEVKGIEVHVLVLLGETGVIACCIRSCQHHVRGPPDMKTTTMATLEAIQSMEDLVSTYQLRKS
jgi:hypothetical protein